MTEKLQVNTFEAEETSKSSSTRPKSPILSRAPSPALSLPSAMNGNTAEQNATIAVDDGDLEAGKRDYQLDFDDEDQKGLLSGSRKAQNVFGIAPNSAGGGNLIETVVSHPALPVFCYCIASILMTVVNKFVVSGRHFNMNFLLLAIQSSVCVLAVVAAKAAKVLTFRDFDLVDARRWFPISCLLVAVIYTGSKSLQFLSIPIYTIWKNITIILIAYGEVIWFAGSVTGLMLISFGLMILSSIMSAGTDISAALSDTASPIEDTTVRIGSINVGYIWMIINCLCTASYVLTMRKRIKITNFSDWDTMFYNNLLSIPILAIATLLVEDWSAESLRANFPADGGLFLLSAMVFSGAAAVGISYTTAWCVRTTSSTTYSMVGALNKLPVAASGMIFFGDVVSIGSVSSVIVGFLAGVVFTVAKLNQKQQSVR